MTTYSEVKAVNIVIREEIASCVKQLRLSQNMVDMSISMGSEQEQQYFLDVLKGEVQYRKEIRIQKSIKNAGFYCMKSFEDFRSDEVNMPSNLSIEQLRAGTFIEEKKNLVFYGKPGSGKTHLAQAIGLEACKKGMNVKFYRTAALVNRLSEAKKAKELSSLMKQIQKADLIILDEWGYVPLDRDGSRLLFEIISECYEQKSIIVTTNIEFSKWATILYDEQMTNALLDRLLHHCYLLIFTGNSDRIKNSLIRMT